MSASDESPVVGVVGLGLIGGSLAKAWIAHGGSAVGWSRTVATREQARAEPGLVVVETVAEVVARADIVVLATPLSALDHTLDQVVAALPVAPGAPTITDVGSVKAAITAHARAVLPDPSIFVPGHPMAGTERAGWASANQGLFTDTRWALAADEPVDLVRWAAVARVAVTVGASVVPVDPGQHDRVVALTSHLPYVLAAALSDLLALEPDVGLAAALVAGSFRSVTRVVSGEGRQLGPELLRANGREVRDRIAQLQHWLTSLAYSLEAGDDTTLEIAFAAPPEVIGAALAAAPPRGEPERLPLDRDLLLAAGRSGCWIEAVDLDRGLVTMQGLGIEERSA